MKLMIAIIQDSISQEVIRQLADHRYPVTKLSSTGGFLKSGNTTLLIGVRDEAVEPVADAIRAVAIEHEDYEKNGKIAMANIFVLPMEDYKRM